MPSWDPDDKIADVVFGKGKGHADDDVDGVVFVLDDDVFDNDEGGSGGGLDLGGGILMS